MAAKQERETVTLVAPNGAQVSVSAEKADRLLADSSWSKAPSKAKAAAKSAGKSTSDD